MLQSYRLQSWMALVLMLTVLLHGTGRRAPVRAVPSPA